MGYRVKKLKILPASVDFGIILAIWNWISRSQKTLICICIFQKMFAFLFSLNEQQQYDVNWNEIFTHTEHSTVSVFWMNFQLISNSVLLNNWYQNVVIAILQINTRLIINFSEKSQAKYSLLFDHHSIVQSIKLIVRRDFNFVEN
jgi:hypothetical protein